MKFPSDKKTPLPYDKKPMKGNTLDFYNDDMSRKAVGRLFDEDDDEKPVAKSKMPDDSTGLEGSSEYIDLDELETYIQKKHVNISSVYEDTGEIPYDISMYQDKKVEKNVTMPQKSSSTTRPPGSPTHVSTLKPALGSAKAAPGTSKPLAGSPKASMLKRPPTKQRPTQEKPEASAKSAIFPSEISTQIKVAVLVTVVVFLAILAALVYRMNSLSAELKEAKDIAMLYDPDMERELNDIKIRYNGLQEENDRLLQELDQASISVPTPPTITSNGQTQTSPPTTQTTPPPAQSDRTHIVAAGDNLYNISRQYYGSPDYINEIMSANNMTGTAIRPGDVLVIPSL